MSRNKFSVDVMYTFAGQIVVMAVLFGMNKYLSIEFQPELYTIYNIAYKASGPLAMGIVFCLGIAVPRYIALYMAQGEKERSAYLVQTAFFLMLFLMLVVIGAYYILPFNWGRLIFGTNAYDGLLWGIIVYGIGLALTTFMYSFYRGIEDYRKYNASQIIVQLFILAIAFWFSSDISSMMIIWGIGMSTFAIIGLERIYRHEFNSSLLLISLGKIQSLWEILVELLRFCLPRVPGELVLFSFGVIPLIILNDKLGTMATGGFVVALIINGAVMPLYGLTGTVLLPYVSRLLGESGNMASASGKINKLMLVYIVSSLVIIAVVAFFADKILCILFDSSYVVYAAQVQLLIVTILPNSIYLLLRNPLDAASVVPYNTINLIVSFVILLGFLQFGTSYVAYISGFILAYSYLGFSSWLCWIYCSRRIGK